MRFAEILANPRVAQQRHHDGENEAKDQIALELMAALVALRPNQHSVVQAVEHAGDHGECDEVLKQKQRTESREEREHEARKQPLQHRLQDRRQQQHETPEDEHVRQPGPLEPKQPGLAAHEKQDIRSALPPLAKRPGRPPQAQVLNALIAAVAKHAQSGDQANEHQDNGE